jgi:hypothetical protein
VSERLRRARRGVRGGCRGGQPPEFFFFFFFGPTYFRRADIFRDDIFPGRHITGTIFHMILGGFSAHGFLPMVFYFRLRN